MSMRKVYRQIARQNGVGVNEVKTEMKAAIAAAYRASPDDGGIIAAYRQQVPSKGDVPTPEEFICYVSGRILKGK
jgi:hypothetical protein